MAAPGAFAFKPRENCNFADASVKVVLYKRCKFCPVFFALSTTEEASHSWGETFGDQKHHKRAFFFAQCVRSGIEWSGVVEWSSHPIDRTTMPIISRGKVADDRI